MYGVLYALCFSWWSVYYWTFSCIIAWVPAILLWWHGHTWAAGNILIIPIMLTILIADMWYRKLRGYPPSLPRR